jgi:hypothetical protein
LCELLDDRPVPHQPASFIELARREPVRHIERLPTRDGNGVAVFQRPSLPAGAERFRAVPHEDERRAVDDDLAESQRASLHDIRGQPDAGAGVEASRGRYGFTR